MFEVIDNDPNNELMVVEFSGEVIGMLQLTFIPYLTHLGSWRCLIEWALEKRINDLSE